MESRIQMKSRFCNNATTQSNALDGCACAGPVPTRWTGQPSSLWANLMLLSNSSSYQSGLLFITRELGINSTRTTSYLQKSTARACVALRGRDKWCKGTISEWVG
ncbi:hypothetical protein SUGI_1227270 [Cryptomeria japonica]|uniref:Uncharacterized protein n=1 Tax=Cryptomeria japonica TaxID=3369 RepID=A0AAD3NMX9_CRYJA|nr:hypothetical protein SUGI_1227270 [Cryptomeria japonica]